MAKVVAHQENFNIQLKASNPLKYIGGKSCALQGSALQNMAAGKRTIEQTYQKKSQLEHVLLRPDTYIGSVERDTRVLWVYEENRMVTREVTFVPGLYKIFDEILVNAADNKQRDPSMDYLRVEIDIQENSVKVWNNGKGVPVEIHAEEGIYVPELIFGHLLTSSNYDDSEQKTTGGRNGFGAKLANIFSTEFVIETADGERQRKYKQVFKNNMGSKTEPLISKCKSVENWTCITFKPDLAKFNMEHLEQDTVALMSKRVIDIAGCLGKTVKVELNGSRVPIKSFGDYVNMYLTSTDRAEPLPRIYEKISDRWEVCVSLSDGQFQQVSFVNSISTTRGGTHVNLVSDQIVNFLLEKVKKKAGKAAGALIKPAQVKSHLWVFVNSLIVNPAFDSQTKEWLNTKPSEFGSSCKLPEEFLKKILAKSGIVENVLSWATFKQNKDLKKTDGSKRQRLTGISKLDDANDAGGRNSQDCTLILTEGDSAKALAVSGLSVVGRDRYGVFPLRGKLLNVRDAQHKQIQENVEITHIKQIMGLQHDKQYEDLKSLRYGHIMIMTDQDHDGSHIKGLLINFLHRFWPSLLKIPNFLLEFVTPIVKASGPRGRALSFYTMPEYESWKESLGGNTKGWTIKYYKGLGTSTPKEAKDYFAALKQHRKQFYWSGEEDGEHIDLAFSKKKIEGRKQWLRNFEPGTFLDQSVSDINYSDFVNKELILFSLADNMRSIPSVMDGFKPGQRKILFSCFKRKLKADVKVAQLAGYISEHSAYHHGEASLMGTIVGLAQDFVGSNNVNVLMPSGQFGTRLQGGKDAASPRYIYTRLNPITRLIFPEADDCLLEYQNEDGQKIEPLWYAPILPMVLVNGSEGIGTGWSSLVPNYNPRDVVGNLKALIRGEEMRPMVPWYRHFKGSIDLSSSKDAAKTFTVTGNIRQVGPTVLEISELPIRRWTQDYKEFLEGMMAPADKNKEPFIRDMKEHHTDTEVRFEVHLSEENMAAALADGLVKRFKLSSSLSTSNMHLFDHEGRITKYDTPEQIIASFYDIRVVYYEKRKAAQVDALKQELTKLDNRVRFILSVVRNEIVVNNRKKAELLAELKAKKFTPLPNASGKRVREGPAVAGVPEDVNGTSSVEEEDEDESEEGEEVSSGKANAGGFRVGYEYLLGMPLWSLTLERVQELCRERDEKAGEMEALLGTEPKQLWLLDLEKFLEALEAMEVESEKEQKEDAKQRMKAKKDGAKSMAGGGRGKAKRNAAFSDDEDDDGDFVVASKKRADASKKAATAMAAAANPKNRKITEMLPKAAPQAQQQNTVTTEKGDFKVREIPEDRAAENAAVSSPVTMLDSDEEGEGLSLADRIALRRQGGAELAADRITSFSEIETEPQLKIQKAPKSGDAEYSADDIFTSFVDGRDREEGEEEAGKAVKKAKENAPKKTAKQAAKTSVPKPKATVPSKKASKFVMDLSDSDKEEAEAEGQEEGGAMKDEFQFDDDIVSDSERIGGPTKRGGGGGGVKGKAITQRKQAAAAKKKTGEERKKKTAPAGKKRTKQDLVATVGGSTFGESTGLTVELGEPVHEPSFPEGEEGKHSPEKKARRAPQPPKNKSSAATLDRVSDSGSESQQAMENSPPAQRPSRAARQVKRVQYIESESEEDPGDDEDVFFSGDESD